MITFKEYLYEMSYLDHHMDATDDPKKAENLIKQWVPTRSVLKMLGSKKVGETDTHDIHHTEKEGQEDYTFVNKKTKQPEACVSGNHNGERFEVDSVAKKRTSSLKMSDALHHLIHHHVDAISSSHFSKGGKKLFSQVAEKEDIESHEELPDGTKKKFHPEDSFKNTKTDPEWSNVVLRKK